jgi:uncharacterized membrane protein
MSKEKYHLGEKIADVATNFIGSWAFIIIQLILIIFWVVLNGSGIIKLDPFPFIFLNLALSFQAAFTAPIIMMSQNRQSKRDRRVQSWDFDVNRKAESEIEQIIKHLNRIESKIDKK